MPIPHRLLKGDASYEIQQMNELKDIIKMKGDPTGDQRDRRKEVWYSWLGYIDGLKTHQHKWERCTDPID